MRLLQSAPEHSSILLRVWHWWHWSYVRCDRHRCLRSGSGRRVRYGRCGDDVILVLAAEKEVDDFENAERVHDEEDDEPDFLMIASRMPKRNSFPDERPEDE
jgi:hypothetical protein